MKKPQPSAEIVTKKWDAFHSANEILHVWAYSKDAEIWIEAELPSFGRLLNDGDGQYTLFISPGFNRNEVEAYLLSYLGA